jgi:hypothetical protein
MSNGYRDAPTMRDYIDEQRGVTAKKLREAGYVPLPRWWAKPEDIDEIRKITSRHVADIFRLSDEAKLEKEMREYEDWMEK